MIKLIQAACQWGQKDFDGWVIGKARYCIHSHSEPVSCESIPQKAARGYVLLETTSYDACRRPCQSLEICLVDIKVLRDSWGAKASTFPASRAASPATSGCMASGCMASGCMPGQMTMTFPQKCLDRFLADSGDSNPIHHGPNAVIPGLWILSRLEEMYGSYRPAETLSIRFLRPVHTGGSVRLEQKNNIVTGTMGSATCFTMTIHTSDQTQKRR